MGGAGASDLSREHRISTEQHATQNIPSKTRFGAHDIVCSSISLAENDRHLHVQCITEDCVISALPLTFPSWQTA